MASTALAKLSVAVAMVAGLCTTTVNGIENRQAADMLKNQTTGAVDRRVDGLLAELTLEEKISLVGGTGMETRPIDRLGIPSLPMTDGPHGVRWGQATCFPTGVGLASTWDEALIQRVGVALARETLGAGRNVILGPCINIHRVPHGGRNFESFSEDPYLAGRMAVAYVKGVQSQRVVACPKHFACNNQEWERTTINAQVDERALREIYLPAFKAAIQEGGAWSIMASYNKLNGPYACENVPLLTRILKDEWGFQGLAMSDWGAVHSTVPTANAGLDLEMPTGEHLGHALLEAVKNGQVAETVIDNKVRRLLRVMALAGLLDGPREADKSAVDCPEHRALALDAARAGIVLLKNDRGVLPLKPDRVRTLAIIGPTALSAGLGGGGSSEVTPTYSVSPLDGLTKHAQGVAVRHARGCDFPGEYQAIDSACLVPPGAEDGAHGLRGEYFNNQNLEGEPLLVRVDQEIDFDWASGPPAPALPGDHFSVRWTGKLIPPKGGTYDLAAISDDGSRLYLDDQLLIDNWADHAIHAVTKTIDLEAGRTYDIRFEYYESAGAGIARLGWVTPGQDALAEAVQLARESDVAVVFAGLSKRFESEGMDKTGLELPGRQDELIEAVCAANRNTIVVLINGSPVLMNRWVEKVPAVVEAWYPGQESGNAIADVLFGRVNPSGKLTVTLPKSWQECPAHGNYPGENGAVRYAEGIFVGYRHYDRKGIEPLFPFGHGLCYTRFEYTDLAVKPEQASADETIVVTLNLKNSGDHEGQEVVQLYVRDVEASLERPVKELKGFRKVSLKPGESKPVTFELDRSSLSFYDPSRQQWVAEPGRFEFLVGSSSRDIRLNGAFELK